MLRILFLIFALFFSITNSSFAQSDPPYAMSETEVWLVQDALHALNYDIDLPDGKLGPQTRAAIIKWQENTRRIPSGQLTEAEVNRFIELDSSDFRYAAIGSSTDGAFTAVWDRQSRSAAKDQALSGCRERAKDPDKCVVVSAISTNVKKQGWVAAIQCRKETDEINYTHVAVASRDTRTDSIDAAYALSSRSGYSQSECRLRAVVEARGRHK